MTNRSSPAGPVPASRSRTLEIQSVPGKSADRLATDLVAQGLATSACTALRFVEQEHGKLSLTDMVASLREHGEAVNRGDLAAAERMLAGQAVALNAIFAEMARVAHANLFKVPEVVDRYMRLALRAQSQSRATVEALSAIKNPPVLYARQANIANGPQQVNNGVGGANL